MVKILEFISERFSVYMIMLILLGSWMMSFVDRGQLKRKGLKREARFSLMMGIVYAVIAGVVFVIKLLPSAR